MSEESDLERTESASPKRLEQAREDGDVPRSKELSTCTVLLTSGVSFWMFGDSLIYHLKKVMTEGLSMEREMAFDANLLFMKIGLNLREILLAFSPIAALLLIVALGSPLLIGGWLFSVKALHMNFSRLNPISGLGNMVSGRAGVELLKAIIKTILVGAVASLVVMNQKEAIFSLALEPLKQSSFHMLHMLGVCFITIVAALIFIAAIDAPYQIWHYHNKLKMTQQEVVQESKEANGNPQIKAKIRQQQREMARRRMMSDVPTADVIVTNPTHFAVALKYHEGAFGAPRVVAKGADAVAAKIREVAKANNVPLLEAPPLARALYANSEIGDEIPEALYAVVAEVLAYVFQLRSYRTKGGNYPVEPKNLPVPAELDPNFKTVNP